MLNHRTCVSSFVVCLYVCTLSTASALTASSSSTQSPTIGSCPVFPADNVWNTPIDQLPVSSYSAAWVGTIGSAAPVHPDFGSASGIPFTTVPGTQTKYPATFQYSGDSDPGPYAVPLNAPIEGGSASTGDRHVISIDTDNCILYEMWSAYPQASSWTAGSGAIFKLTSDALRPSGWTSADAAGLPVYPALVRYDEVASGQINHALRFTAPHTQNTFIWPARHAASNLTGYQYPPMGARFRLRADFDISRFSPVNQVILTALKKYGMILADNGSSWFVQGVPDPRWSDDDLHALTQIPGSAFEAVDESSIMVSPDSGQTTAGNAPATTVSLNPASATVTTGSTVGFTATVNNAATQSVTWSVNGVAGGNSVVGTISSNGLYTAPATVPNGGAVTISATSTAATNVSASATVTVNAPAAQPPVVSSVSPSSGTAGATVTVTLNGANFLPGATVSISGGSGVTVSGVTVVSASQVAVVLSIDATASAGTYGVSVTTSAGTSSAAGFTVIAPVVSTQMSGTTQSTTSTATTSESSATATTQATSTPTTTTTVTAAAPTTTQSTPTIATATQSTSTTTQPTEAVIVPVPVAVAPTTTDTTQSASTSNVPTPVQPTQPVQSAPSVTSVSANSVVAGNTVSVTIYGANFTSDASVVVQGLRIITRDVVVVDSNTITAQIVTSAHTPPGTDPLTVKTSAGTSNTVGFTIE